MFAYKTYEMNHRFFSHRHVEIATSSSHGRNTFTTSRHVFVCLLMAVSTLGMNLLAVKGLHSLVLRFIDSCISHPPFRTEIGIS